MLIRVADACVSGCEQEADARRIRAVLPTRVARVGLTMHPTKTVLVSCRKPDARTEADTGHGTCACLGLTHDGARARRGSGVIQRNTAGTRLRRAQKSRGQWCRSQRHPPRPAPYRQLCHTRRGHDQDSGIRGHDRTLEALCTEVAKAWRDWLSRRSHKSAIPWETCDRLQGTCPLPAPSIVHAI